MAASGSSARMRAIASTPSPSGIRRSIRVTSGRRARQSTTAWRPEPAWPTTSIVGSESETRRATPARVASWSSAISSRTRAAAGGVVRRRPAWAARRGRACPTPGSSSTSSVPPSSRARSAIPRMPIPWSAPARSTSSRSKPSPSSCTSSVTWPSAWTTPIRTERASAWWSALVSASWAIRKSEWATSARSGAASPATTSRTSADPVRLAQASSRSSASSSELPASGEGARPSTLRRVSSRANRAAAPASWIAVRSSAARSASRAPSATRRCSSTETSPLATVSCTSRAIRLRSSAAASARALASADSCRRAYVIARAAWVANSSSRRASSSSKTRSASRLKIDAGADDARAPPDRHADDGPQGGAVGLGHVPAAHLPVVAERDRRPLLDDGAGDALAQREDVPRLAGHADVGLLAVDAADLVHEADRPGVALEQLDRALEDPLQQGAQRQLGAQVLDDGLERRRARALARDGGSNGGPGSVRWHRAPLGLVGAGSGDCMPCRRRRQAAQPRRSRTR